MSELPYLMVKTEKENDKPEKESGKPDNASTQQEIEQPKPLKEGKAAVGTGDVAVSPGNVVHDVAVKEKTDSLDKEKRKGSSQGSGTMGRRKRTAVGT